ncbi:MAG: glutamate--tRNA ligase [Rhodobiaceae bacterium]|mgnify:CR=1 FL=1|jgi:glutamyl-tRNA synthetase|nr:glutamate--tRNA ligase [Rhodobiaceae bacterium]MDG2495081.1 glutamate--tRNA ligase [Alphaproteobacteria bacterium]
MSEPKKIVTRFAPSPTGFLHIGGARTALFNWAFARHHGGSFLLRIEDTDRARSTQAAIDAILDGMHWLGLDADEPPSFQHAQAARHVEVAEQLLADGHAYKCFCTAEEVEAMRETARLANQPLRYDGTWRDRNPSEAAPEAPFVIRFKAPQTGETIIQDAIQGEVTFANAQFDDLILLRSDGSPTYMLSVVVDDYDMGVTHVIRGDDHLTNAGRQAQIYTALNWPLPVFAHMSLIHGSDGAKLSKRHGALGVDAYRDMGYLPEAMRNYLARLGWSHGDEEVFSTAQLVDWFSLDAVGKAPARFDIEKLDYVNAQHLNQAEDADLTAQTLALDADLVPFAAQLEAAMPLLKERASRLGDLVADAAFLKAKRPISVDEKLAKHLQDDNLAHLSALQTQLEALQNWSLEPIEACIKAYMEAKELKMGKLAPAFRAALVGNSQSPGIFDVLALLGRDEALGRIKDKIG